MNTLNIIIKELKQLVRDKIQCHHDPSSKLFDFHSFKSFQAILTTLKLGDVSVLYTNTEESLEQSFEMFMETINKERHSVY